MASAVASAPLLSDGAWDALAHSILVIAAGYLLMTATRLSSVLISATVTETGQLATPGAAMGVLLKMFVQELQDQFAFPVIWTMGAVRAHTWLRRESRSLCGSGKSLSCPALMENLHSPSAVEACTDMLEEFERHQRGRRLTFGVRTPRLPSMPALAEADAENEDASFLLEEQQQRSPAKMLAREAKTLAAVCMHHAIAKCGGLPHVVVLGDAGVGKSAVMEALQALASEAGCVQLRCVEGLPCGAAPARRTRAAAGGPSPPAPPPRLFPASPPRPVSRAGDARFYAQVGIALVVWDAGRGAGAGQPPRESLAAYVERHLAQLRHASEGARLPKLVVLSNKSDATLCPMSERAGDACTPQRAARSTARRPVSPPLS